jgi:hypothetical protein
MLIPNSRIRRDINGEKADSVIIHESQLPLKINSDGFDWDEIQITYPSATQEVFSYYLDSALIRTIVVNYLTSSKKDISSVVKS